MRGLTLVGAALLLAACGSGSDNLSGGTSWNGQGDPGGGSGGGGGSDGGGGGGGGGGMPAQVPQLVTNLTLAEIAVFQGVKVGVMSGGTPATRKAPVVANRDALVRVYVAPGNGWSAHEVTARLVIDSGGTSTPMDVKLTPSTASTDADMGTTFNFDVPGSKIGADAKIKVALLDFQKMGPPVGSTPSTARWPADGTQATLDAKSSGASIKIVLVPVRYGFDGSNRMPDTSANQIQAYASTMFGMYPTAKVDVTVRQQAVQIAFGVYADGTGWNQLLTTILNVRASDAAAPDVYYYGAFAPAASMGAYCGTGCVAGLSPIVDMPGDAASRGSIGLGFAGIVAAQTMAHEIGHAHGRPHAPCGGASGTDPNYPYAQAGIGAWGWDLSAKKLIAPTQAKDVMSYCNPSWISDYNYNLLFNRIKTINGAFIKPSAPVSYRFAALEPNGTITFTGSAMLTIPPSGKPIAVHWPSSGAHGTAWFYPVDHVAGGTLLVPDGPSDVVIDSPIPGLVDPELRVLHIAL